MNTRFVLTAAHLDHGHAILSRLSKSSFLFLKCSRKARYYHLINHDMQKEGTLCREKKSIDFFSYLRLGCLKTVGSESPKRLAKGAATQ